MTQGNEKKILICVLSYNAANHIVEVFNRIPRDFLNSEEHTVHVAVFDDASKDDTYEIALDYAKGFPDKIKIFKYKDNQGYGGNQKLAYSYAIKNGYDIAIMLHGDAQYAPELLPDMAKPIIEGGYGVVLGSRMINRKQALAGGMPKYKFVGNIGLTTFQNIMLGAKLAEYHTGYRAYSTEALKQVPFELDSDYFEFDTDILIQMIHKKIPIKEIPIPTHYGDEVCNVNVVKYGLRVLKSTTISVLNRMGILKTPKFNYSEQSINSARNNFSSKYSRYL